MWALSNSGGIQVIHQQHISDPARLGAPPTTATTSRRLLPMATDTTHGACGSATNNVMPRVSCVSTTSPSWQQQQRRTSTRKQLQQSVEGSSPRTAVADATNMVCSKRAAFVATSVDLDNEAARQQTSPAPSSLTSVSTTPAPTAASVTDTSSAGFSIGSTSTSTSSTPSDRALFSPDNSNSATTTPPSIAAGRGCEDPRGFDTEALLLEPLLPSPRSHHKGTSSNKVHCENQLSLGASEDSSSNNTSGMSSSSHHNSSAESAAVSAGWHNHGADSTCASSASSAVSTGGMSAGGSGNGAGLLIPVSPALTAGHQRTGPFTPVGESRLRSQEVGGNLGSSSSGSQQNSSGWYLNLPPHAQAQAFETQKQQQQSIAGACSNTSANTAAAVAAAAANVAAAIHQASMPFSATSSSTSSPGLSQQQHMSVNRPSSSKLSPTVASTTSAPGARRSPSAWQRAALETHVRSVTAADAVSGGIPRGGGGDGDNSTSVSHSRPRFVTKEECLPGAHTAARGGPMHATAAATSINDSNPSPWSTAMKQEVTASSAKRNLQGGLNEPQASYARSCSPASSGGGREFSLSPGGGGGDASGDEGFNSWQPSSRANSFGENGTGVSRPGKRMYAQVTPSPRAVGAGGAMHTMRSSPSGLRIDAVGISADSGGDNKRAKTFGSTPDSSAWGSNFDNGNKHGGWGSAAAMMNTHNQSYAAISPEEMHRVSPAQVPDSVNNTNNRRRRSARSVAGAASVQSAAALEAASGPLTSIKRDGSSTEDDESIGGSGDSTRDWTERDSDEEMAAAATGGGGDGGDGRGAVAGKAAAATCGDGKGSIKASNKVPFKLDPRLWVVVERRAICSAKQCAYRNEEDHRARRRHYHALCSHVHQNGERKGMRFQHHQLEKVQKHQRAHQVTAKQNSQRSNVVKTRSPSGSPVARSKRSSTTNGMREQTRAIKDANVEAHSPKDWTPELTKKLQTLVDELGPKWSAIAERLPGKTATACMLHWRVGLNPHHMVKGSGTWTAEEDERLSKLVEVVGMKWSDLARHIPGRIAKQCRERYLNHLDPSLRKDMPWTEDEEALLMRLCFAKQNQWAEICRQLHGRSYNDVKNRFNLIQRRNKRASLNPAPPQLQPQSTSSGARTPASSSSSTTTATSAGSRTPPITPNTSGDITPTSTPFQAQQQQQQPNSVWGMATSASRPTARRSGSAAAMENRSIGAMGSRAGMRGPSPVGGNGNTTPLAVQTNNAPNGWAAAAATAVSQRRSVGGGGFPSQGNGGNGMNMTMGSQSNLQSFSSGRPAPTAAAAAAVASINNSNSNNNNNNNPQQSFATLMGDELGDFALVDANDLGGPGTGFAPGGYWHQVVKEESPQRRALGGGGGGGDVPDNMDAFSGLSRASGAGGAAAAAAATPGGSLMSMPAASNSANNGGSPLMGGSMSFMDGDCGSAGLGGEEEGGVRLPPPPPLGVTGSSSMDTL